MNLSKDTPRFLLAGSMLIALVTRLFTLLHEIGHIELGHLRRWQWPPWHRKIWRNEALLIQESTSQRKQEEHDADVFAIQQVEPTKRSLLLNGAIHFFLLLSIAENAIARPSDTHPHAGNRLNFLFNRFGTYLDNGEKSDKLFEAIKKLHESWQSRGVSATGGELMEKLRGSIEDTVSDEALAVLTYSMLSRSIVSESTSDLTSMKAYSQFPT